MSAGGILNRVAIYPGSFNPWHVGHTDILRKALQLFSLVVVAKGINPDKPASAEDKKFPILASELLELAGRDLEFCGGVVCETFSGLLSDYVKEKGACAVIRGLRNGHDLQYEMNQQYWYEDLGLEVPIVYFITDRKLSHISSSAIRALEPFRRK